MFDSVALHYDRVNSLFTLGFDAHWRKKMVKALGVGSGDKVLDLAAGTAVSTKAVKDITQAWVVGADFSLGMLLAAPAVDFPLVKADALALPFGDNSFDGVCIAFGLRNVQNPITAIEEIYRVLKPGGRCVILESSVPSNKLLKAFIQGVGYRFTALIGAVAGSNASAYKYLVESVLEWPDAKTLAEIISRIGYSQVQIKKLLGGVVAIHIGFK